MRALFDVNLLIALFQPHHIHYQSAHQWWDENRAHGWASCPLTQNGFVRIVSQPKYKPPLRVAEAASVLTEQAVRTDHIFWPDDIALLDEKLFHRDRILGPKQLTDVYLLGLAVKHGGRLATFDEAIPLGAVKGAGPRHLAVVPTA